LNERNGTIELHCYSAVTSPSAKLAKRMLDIGLILMFSVPLILLSAVLMVLVRISSPGPIFFGSKRMGQGGTVFRAWKFRSMVVNGHEVLEKYFAQHPEDREIFLREHKLKDDPRITPIGRFLRKTSLDELPQLWNVIRGEMSLVGPRPILEEEHEKYGRVYDLYVAVRPGITGLWQVSGRNNLEYEERLRLTRFYIQNWSCTLDLYILWRTVRTALIQEGAY
jgi:Undecaprenyl-phosphate galactose phosphotransferase WbaP